MNPGRLDGKVAIITGAGSGIGAAAAQRFAEEGAAVVCADVRAAERTAAAVTAAGGRALAVDTDVTDEDATRALASRTLEAFGGIDVLFANAGIAGFGSATQVDRATWDQVLAVNLTGVWLSMRAVLPTMVAQERGSIICTASSAALIGIRGIAAYSAAKAGVVGLVRSTAVEVAPAGVRVNALAPGTVPTPLVTETFGAMVSRGDAEEDRERTQRALEREQQRYPMGRFGTLDEVVGAALFLASDDSTWVTGTVQVVDGGLTAA
jgi:NAD(P)-dependent dehydrogenase (short-subunit alcohol dehydrogenase family)